MLKKIKKSILVIILILLLNLVLAQDFDDLGFKSLYDIRDNVAWKNGQSVEISLNKGSIIVFDIFAEEELAEGEKCQLVLTSVQKITKSAVFSLQCVSLDSQPVIIRKDTSKEIDVDYDDKNDISLLLKKIDKKEDKITVGINRVIEVKEKGISSVFKIILITIIVLVIINHLL